MSVPERAAILDLYAEGVDAIETISGSLPDDPGDRAWHRTVAGDWSTEELGRHLLAVTDWYHEWLDRSEAGDGAPPFPVKQLDDRNELGVHDRRALTGPEAFHQFAERAHAYLHRLIAAADEDAEWDRPYGFAYGTSTVGLHAGAAAAEWHLHAWDLSAGEWQPSDPADLYLGAAGVMISVQPRFQRLVTRRVVPIIARRDPWNDLLKRSGRDPLG